MTTSTAEIVACSLAFSLAAFLITFAIYQDIPWLYIIDWILIGVYGLAYFMIKLEYKKNLVGDSYIRKYYKPLNTSPVHPVTMSINGSFTSHD